MPRHAAVTDDDVLRSAFRRSGDFALKTQRVQCGEAFEVAENAER